MIFRRQPTMTDWQQAQIRKIKPLPPFKKEIKEIASVSTVLMIPSFSVLRTHDWSLVAVNLVVAALFFAFLTIYAWLSRY